MKRTKVLFTALCVLILSLTAFGNDNPTASANLGSGNEMTATATISGLATISVATNTDNGAMTNDAGSLLIRSNDGAMTADGTMASITTNSRNGRHTTTAVRNTAASRAANNPMATGITANTMLNNQS